MKNVIWDHMRNKTERKYQIVPNFCGWGKTEGKEKHGKPRRRRDDNITVDLLISTTPQCTYLQEISCKGH
jgi:hypothetical protein